MQTSEKFTWNDLKAIIDSMPAELMNEQVVIWHEDDDAPMPGMKVTGFEILDEDYVFDGDEGVAPLSVMKDGDPEGWQEYKEDCPVIYPKGSRILNGR